MNNRTNLSVKEAAHFLGAGRSFVYSRLVSGEIPSLKMGKKRLVPIEALEAYQARCRQGGWTPGDKASEEHLNKAA